MTETTTQPRPRTDGSDVDRVDGDRDADDGVFDADDADDGGDGGHGGDGDDGERGGGGGDGEGGPDPAAPWWRRVDRQTLLVVGVVAVGFVLVLRGLLVGVTGDERSKFPDEIEDVAPVPEAVQALSQTSVFVDLAPEYTGVLIIDGVRIETVNVEEIGRIDVEPGQQVDLPPVTIYEPGNATLTFTPGSSAPIESFAEGEHRVTVEYWRIDEDPQRARRYTWTFDVI